MRHHERFNSAESCGHKQNTRIMWLRWPSDKSGTNHLWSILDGCWQQLQNILKLLKSWKLWSLKTFVRVCFTGHLKLVPSWSPSSLSFRLVLMAPNHKGALEDLLNLIRTDQNSQFIWSFFHHTNHSSVVLVLAHRVSKWHQETTRATQQFIGKSMAFPSFFSGHKTQLTFSIGEAFARLDLSHSNDLKISEDLWRSLIQNLERHLRLKSGWASHWPHSASEKDAAPQVDTSMEK